MSRYMMPVRVNSRKYVSLHLYDDQQSTAENEQRFVCSIPQMGKLELLYFSINQQATSDQCQVHDKKVVLERIEQPDKSAKNYVLHFREVDKEPSDELQLSNEIGLSLEKMSNNHYVVNYKYSLGGETVSILCQLHDSDKVWQSMLSFQLIPEKDMFRMALDFGSEASQGLCLPMEMGSNEVSLRFIDLAKNHFYERKYAQHDNSDFHQFQSDREMRSNLFRSVFYVKDGRPLFLSLQSEDNALQKDSKQLPNIKIALLGNDSINIIRYYSNIVLNFIRSACYHIIESYHDGNPYNTLRGLRLDLLVPNVMSMGLTKKLLNELQVKFDSMMDDPVMGLFCLEINTFSESDASFLGYFQNHRQSQNRLVERRPYLMIDGGKGTMDFSIISILDTEHYDSTYRDGFVGSGNALTYALFDHICAVIVGFMDNENRKKLMRSLLFSTQTDQLGLRKLLNELEAIKAAEKNPVTAERNCKALKNNFSAHWNKINLETLTQHLHDHPGDYGDSFGIIHATCDKICKLLVENLIRNRIVSGNMPDDSQGPPKPAGQFDEVILAGRAFRYPLLRETLASYMKRFFGIEKNKIRFDASTAKISCLYGLFHFQMVNSNCGLSGIPSIGVVFENEQPTQNKKSRNTAAELDSMFNTIFQGAQRQAVKSRPVESFKIDEEFLNQGCNIQIESNEVLYMNGHEIEAVSRVSDANDGSGRSRKYNLYFDGTELLLRNANNVSPLRRTPAQIPVISTLIYESRFPNYDRGADMTDYNGLCSFQFPEFAISQKQ